MKREDIAWDHLDPIKQAQQIRFYPELAEDKHRARQDAGRLGGINKKGEAEKFFGFPKEVQ